MRDCNVFSRDMLDDNDVAHFPLPWLVEDDDGVCAQFATEDEACAFQRQWRADHGLDPMTGEQAG